MPDLDHANHFPYEPQDADNMSTEELERLLREDFESEETDPDPKAEAFLLHAAEVIAQREKDDPDAPHFDMNAGWRKTRKHLLDVNAGWRKTWKHLLDVDAGRKKYQQQFYISTENPSSYNCSPETIQELQEMLDRYKEKVEANLDTPQPEPEPERADHRIPWKKLLALAAAAAVLVGCFLAADGDNLFKMRGSATTDTFQFQPETGPSQNITQTGTYLEDDQTLHDLLAEQGITEPVSLKWIPKGYILSDLRPYLELDEPVFTALYESESGDSSIIQWVIVHRTVQPALAENNDPKVTVYTAGDIDHHIIRNDDTLTVTWFNENIECSLIGEISEEEMEAMINSIYEE